MKSERLSQILKNEYVQTIILTIILFFGIFAFWFGLRFAFQTEFPFLAVASGSMEPFLYRGDLIIVQGISNFSELHVALYRLPNGTLNPTPGEVIVYHDPRYDRVPVYLPVAGAETHLIVHRAVDGYQHENGTWFLYTKGDASWGSGYDPWTMPDGLRQDFVVGKVIGKVPWLGNIPLFMHENPVTAAFIIGSLFVVLIIVDFIFPQKEEEEPKGQKEKLLNSINNDIDRSYKRSRARARGTETPKSFLKKCIKCHEEIPIASEECPHCGTKQPEY